MWIREKADIRNLGTAKPKPKVVAWATGLSEQDLRD